MISVPRATARPQVGLRRLGALLVLAGVLAMHVLGGGSHMAMTSTPQAGSGLTHAVPGVQRTAKPIIARPVMAMPALAPAAAGASDSTDGVSSPRVAAASAPAVALDPRVGAACVAVLLGLALLTARAAVGVPRPPHPPAFASGGHSSAPLGRGPPRQLLAKICVLRT